jgi:hypothetical protein
VITLVEGEALELSDSRLRELETLIRRSFRVRENQTPVYVDVGGHLDRVGLAQHQIVFGRRGSGKSCLLVYFRREVAPKDDVHTIYVLADTIKTLDYPDVLIRLLLAVFENLPRRSPWQRFRGWISREPSAVDVVIDELRELLALPPTSKVKVTKGATQETTKSRKAAIREGPAEVGLGRDRTTGESHEETRESDDEKIRTVERRLPDYKRVLQDELAATDTSHALFIVDDFYLINPIYHPEVLDYLHRLLRDTDLYLKVGTVRHRTRLLRTEPIHMGVQVDQDVDGFNLDQTLEDLDRTAAYLEEMLRKLGQEVGIPDVVGIMSENARKDLTLLSGGVPRDYLIIFIGGLERARGLTSRRRVTPTDLRQAAASLSQETKLRDLRTDAGSEVPALEALFVDLVKFCLSEKGKTAFLIAKEEIPNFPEVHELIQQLMDFKLIHLVEPSTSAASGRAGRFEAYTLDFALFMEPRRRNIEIVRFWETDDQRRRVRLREAPIYELSRGEAVISGEGGTKAEEALQIAESVPTETNGESLRLFTEGD